MADTPRVTVNVGFGSTLWFVSFLMFVVIKRYGHSLDTWSYWWLLWTPEPALWLLFTKLGWMA